MLYLKDHHGDDGDSDDGYDGDCGDDGYDGDCGDDGDDDEDGDYGDVGGDVVHCCYYISLLPGW